MLRLLLLHALYMAHAWAYQHADIYRPRTSQKGAAMIPRGTDA